jgi:acyl-coenzyme A synthetase/AMP-(fatty) acid ligase
LINIAGKRTSLTYLNHQIESIEGVEDAAFYLPPGDDPLGVNRLTAFVVAPRMTRESLMTSLRERIDPAFMPRPLVMIDTLPRNATGKLTQGRLDALYLEKVKRG